MLLRPCDGEGSGSGANRREVQLGDGVFKQLTLMLGHCSVGGGQQAVKVAPGAGTVKDNYNYDTL